MADDRSVLQQARQASEAMLYAAKAGRWNEVTSLQAQCTQLLQPTLSWTDAERQSLVALQACCRKVQDLASAARLDVADQLRRHRQVHRGLSAYLHAAAGA